MITRKVRILIGTSEPAILRSARILLRHHLQLRGGAVISSAAGCDDLVRRIAIDKFDLIVLFGQTLLPSLDRFLPPLKNSVQAIFDITSKVSTPIIALSTIPKTRSELLAAGADVFVAMPYTSKDFAAAVERGLKHK